MPKVTIELMAGSSLHRRTQISDAIHAGMKAALGTLDKGRFHVFIDIESTHIISDPAALPRGDGLLFITFFLAPRPAEMIAELYRAVVAELSATAGVTEEKIAMIVSDTPSGNWWWQGKYDS